MQDWELVLFVVGLSTTLWIIIGYLTARLGPWARLVERYPVNQSVQTTMKVRFVSLEYGWLSYGNCLRIDFGDDHITVSMSWAVLPFHPPFLVPKSAIQDCRHGRFLLIHWIRFRVDDCRFLLWGLWERSAVLEELRCRRVNH